MLSVFPLLPCYAVPHIKPFIIYKAPAFSFHGQYDGVMMMSKEFADAGSGVDNPRMIYSYISGTSVKIGTDIHILEVQDDGSMFHVPSL